MRFVAFLLIAVVALLTWVWSRSFDTPAPPVSAPAPVLRDSAAPQTGTPAVAKRGDKTAARTGMVDDAWLMEKPDYDVAEIVSRHQAAAEAGDPDSVLVMSDLMTYCRGSARDESHLEETLLMNLSDAVKQMIRIRFVQCRELLRETPNLNDLAAEWLQRSLKTGHPMHKLRRPGESREDRRAYVAHLLDQLRDEPFLVGNVVQYGAWLYGAYPGFEDPARAAALEWMSCRYRLNCLPGDIADNLNTQFRPREVDEIRALAVQYEVALRDGTLADLLH